MNTSSSTSQAYQVLSDHLFAGVVQHHDTGQKALHATMHFAPGDMICQFHAGDTLPHPSYLTVQIGDEQHITLKPDFLQYINHSCSPNAFFDTTTMELVCIKAIQPGDEFTFFYPGTEWEMAQPFTCYCNSPECIQLVSGAAQLPIDILHRYRLTDFIQHKVRTRLIE